MKGNALNSFLTNLNYVYVNSDASVGEDTPRAGSAIKPYRTIGYALAQRSDFAVPLYVSAFGVFSETDFLIQPNLILDFNMGTFTVTNSIVAHASWITTPGKFSLKNLNAVFTGGISASLASSTASSVSFENIVSDDLADWVITGNASGGVRTAFYNVYGFPSAPKLKITNCDGRIVQCAIDGVEAQNTSASNPLKFEIFNNILAGDVLYKTTSTGTLTVKQSSNEFDQSWMLDGASISILTDPAITESVSYANGASISDITFIKVRNEALSDMIDGTMKANVSGSMGSPQDITYDVHLGRVPFGYLDGGLISDPAFTYDIVDKRLAVNLLRLNELITPGILHNDGVGDISSSLIVDADVHAAAAIDYSKINSDPVGSGFLNITLANDTYQLTNPMPNLLIVGGTTGSVVLPKLNELNAPASNHNYVMKLISACSGEFSLGSFNDSYSYTISPGQQWLVYVIDNNTEDGEILLFLDTPIFAPDGEIVFGSGTGVTHSDAFTYNKLTETLEVPQIKSNTFGEGYHEIDDGLSYTVINPQPTIINVTNAGSGLAIFLPDMTESAALRFDRFPSFFIYNNGGQPIDVLDKALTTLVSIQPGEGYQFTVTSNSTVAGSFIFEKILIPEINLDTFGSGYLALTVAAGTINLTNPLKNRIVMTGLGTGSVRFPIMNTMDSMTSGRNTFCIITNNCSFLNDICNNAGTVIVQIYPGETYAFFIKDNASPNGSFDYLNITGLTVAAQTITGQKTFSSAPILSSLTASTVLVLDASKNIASSAITSTALATLSQTANQICYGNGASGITSSSALTYASGVLINTNAGAAFRGNGSNAYIGIGANSSGSNGSIFAEANTATTYFSNSLSGDTIIRNSDTSKFVRIGVGSAVSQVSISNTQVGIGATSSNASAILEVASTTRGSLVCSMTTAQMNLISSPASGLKVYDNLLVQDRYYNGSAWSTTKNVTTITTSQTINNDYENYLVNNAASTPVTITLPLLSTVQVGTKIRIIKISANSSNSVSTVAGGSDVIHPNPTNSSPQYDYRSFVSVGSFWLFSGTSG